MGQPLDSLKPRLRIFAVVPSRVRWLIYIISIASLIWRLPNSVSTDAGGLLLETGKYDLPLFLATVFYVVSISLFYGYFKNVRPVA